MTKSQGSGMGKYVKKANVNSKETAAPVEAAHHQPYLGVRTRAKTLALKRLQESSPDDSSCYLQLRSRRLEKHLRSTSSVRSRAASKNSSLAKPGPNPSPSPKMSSNQEAGMGEHPANSNSVGSVSSTNRCLKRAKMETAAAAAEASFGKNALELDASRSVRETTPCSLIKDSEAIETPSSTTRRTKFSASNKKQASVASTIPTTLEMEELFAGPEQLHQRNFIEKYNFDVAKDQPLPGRYEWVKLDS
ncbi:cyclin-dependent kinase inhibitor 4 isoform X1 [Canna indica]|uniref:Cyclin-dependent kinase inhibitor 4 isoform X1 n=1 Tax=Canna indica TaxID=4628 RepID=A0AAQ3K2F4_9LILI|nr:cyclin-dependent kinase inhibitor 4 isoform X1 [Canna indica]